MKNWNSYFDLRYSSNLIVQVGAYFPGSIDGGDTLQRNGFFELPYLWEISKMGNCSDSNTLRYVSRCRFLDRMASCQVGPGLFVRHPDKKVSHSSIWKTSRDQMRANIVVAGLLGEREMVKSILAQLAKRAFRYWNIMQADEPNWHNRQNWVKSRKIGDLSGPEDFGLYIRALNFLPAYPLLLVLDIFMIVGTLVKLYTAYMEPKHKDDVSRIVLLIQAKLVMPTPFSYLARRLYHKYRPGYRVLTSQSGTKRYVRDKNYYGPQYALDYYFKWHWEPPFNELYKPYLKEMLK